MTDPIFQESHRALITMQNRPPLCLRCDQEGHVRARCDTPFCTKCNIFGHRLVDCPGCASYASAVRTREQDDADMDSEGIENGESMSDQESVGDALHIAIPGEGQKRNRVATQTEELAPSSLGTESKKIKVAHTRTASPVRAPSTNIIPETPEPPSNVPLVAYTQSDGNEDHTQSNMNLYPPLLLVVGLMTAKNT